MMVCWWQDLVVDAVVGNVGADPALSTSNLVQEGSEVSGVGQLGLLCVQIGAFS